MFTHDGAFVVASAYPPKAEVDKARKDHKRADEMPRGGMIVVNLASLSASRIADVASFQVPELGESFVAYLKGPKAGERAPVTESPAQDQELDQDQRRGGAGNGATGGRRRKEFGSDLVLRDLRSSKERMFEEVVEFSISKDAGALVYAVGSKKPDSNGVFSVAPGTDSSAAALLTGKGRYTKLTWDFPQSQLAFLSDRDDAAKQAGQACKAYCGIEAEAAIEVVSNATAGFPRRLRDFRSRADEFFARRVAAVLELRAGGADRGAGATRRLRLRPMRRSSRICGAGRTITFSRCRKCGRAQERVRSYRAVVNLADKKFFQLSDPDHGRLDTRATTAAWRSAWTIARIATWWITTELTTTFIWWIRRRVRASWR